MTTITNWLRETLIEVPDVQYAAQEINQGLIFQNHSADLVVQTWMGKRLYVYVIDSIPRTREIKGILKDNTRDGIGTLFLVQHDLLPEPTDEHYKPEDWHLALLTLNDSWIYTYREQDKADWALGQVHFSPIGRGDFFNVWHLYDFEVENVSVRQRDIQNGIKGRWFVGDIASPSFKRRVNYERINQRYHYSTRSREQAPPKNGKPRATPDEIERCYRLLRVEVGASQKEVKAAFRQLAFQLHPDVSALPRAESERRFKQINEAYERIKQHQNWD